MLVLVLLAACANDRYLNHTVYVEETDSSSPALEPPPCATPLFEVHPTSVDFFAAVTPWEDDIELQTDTETVEVHSLCAVDVDIMLAVTGGSVGRFALVRRDDDRDGAHANEYIFTLAAGATHVRSITYTASDDAAHVGYDEGLLTAASTLTTTPFAVEAALDATVIDATFVR